MICFLKWLSHPRRSAFCFQKGKHERYNSIIAKFYFILKNNITTVEMKKKTHRYSENLYLHFIFQRVPKYFC